ncbi:competence type IV pilus minor pilin ComGE [Streptococcus macacae]|nr:competence type IV pilus minor pilin ComGE [Streptococcus macacae]
MVNIKKRKVRAYILLEALVSLAILVTVTSLILHQLTLNQKRLAKSIQQQEMLNLAIMAVQTKQDKLNLNNNEVQIVRSENGLKIYHNQKEVMKVVKKIP